MHSLGIERERGVGIYPEELLTLALRCSLSLLFVVCPLPTSKRALEGMRAETPKPARPPGLSTPEAILGAKVSPGLRCWGLESWPLRAGMCVVGVGWGGWWGQGLLPSVSTQTHLGALRGPQHP